MTHNEQLLVVTSADYSEEVELITKVASRLGIDTTSIVAPLSLQARVTNDEMLPRLLKSAITGCDGMIVLLDSSPHITPFRMAVLDYFTNQHLQVRAASMPGVRVTEFHYAAANAQELDSLTELLGAALLRTKRLRVETWDHLRTKHILEFPVIGRPTACGSRIAVGNWDNIPSGETYVLPRPYAAHGTIVINGSIPGQVIQPGESLILTIDRGRVAAVDGQPESLVTNARDLFFRDYSKRQIKSRNVVSFCEIGLGVNRTIPTFHGIPVFDEKIYGTIHVGFGRNTQLGGKIKGSAHHDLVVRNASVYSDAFSAPLVAKGKVLITPEHTEPDWTLIPPVKDRRLLVHSRGLNTQVRPETGELILEWFQTEGSRAWTRIGNHETSRMAAKVMFVVKSGDHTVEAIMSEMFHKHDVPTHATGAALTLLRSFGLITLSRQREL